MAEGMQQPTLDQAVHEACRDLIRNNKGCEKRIEHAIARIIIGVNHQIDNLGIDSLNQTTNIVCDAIEVFCGLLPQGVQQEANQVRRRIQAQLQSGELQWSKLTHPEYTALTSNDLLSLEADADLTDDYVHRQALHTDVSQLTAQIAGERAMHNASSDPELAKVLTSVAVDASRDFIIGKLQALKESLVDIDHRHENHEEIWTACIDELEEIISALLDAHGMAISYRAVFSVLLADLSRRLQNDGRMTDQDAKDRLERRFAALSEQIESSIQ